MPVICATRGSITVQVGDKVVTVGGEMLGRSMGEPDYQVYADSFTTWDPPHDNEALTQQEKERILNEVCEYLRQHGRIPIVLQ